MSLTQALVHRKFKNSLLRVLGNLHSASDSLRLITQRRVWRARCSRSATLDLDLRILQRGELSLVQTLLPDPVVRGGRAV